MAPTCRLTVLAPGPLSTVQDRGRPGWCSSGVGVSGAADRRSFALGNRLVGNLETAASIESLMGGLVVRAGATAVVAVTGAPTPITVDGSPRGHATVIVVRAGQCLALGTPPTGLRTYLAVRGGVDAEVVLGSRSHDTLAGLGPAPLVTGAELAVGSEAGPPARIDVAPVPTIGDEPVIARVRLGPRHTWFTRPEDLFRGSWAVDDSADRIGARIVRRDGPLLTRIDPAELPSEGMVLGALQVPPSGAPVVLLADHPITGGYPVIGVVIGADVDALAQARPGREVAFTPARAEAAAGSAPRR